MRFCDEKMFGLLPQWKQYLIVRCLLEMGLIHRYLWDFAAEVSIEHFAEKLAQSIEWGGLLPSLRDRFYEVYLAALAYAGDKQKLAPLETEIDRLILPTPEGQSRRLQLKGLCAYVLDRRQEGIEGYETAIREFQREPQKWLKNIAHSLVMIAAMKANGEEPDRVASIKQEYEEKIKNETGQEVANALNAFYWRVWQRFQNNTFRSIWTE